MHCEDYKGNTAYKDKKVPRVPEMTGMFALQYDREIHSGMSLVARAGYQYVGKTCWNLENDNSESAYSLVNATLGLEGDWWRFYLWGKNLTDEKYVCTAVMWGGGRGRLWRAYDLRGHRTIDVLN